MEDIKVSILKRKADTNYQMQYRDPATGNKVRKTTGEKRKREAERVAAKWEAKLAEGRGGAKGRITWKAFRDRYEREILDRQPDETAKKTYTAFKYVEKILSPGKLSDMTSERIAYWLGQLRDGRADATVGIYCRHLRSALYWAVDLGLLRDKPKFRMPWKASTTQEMKGRPITGEEHDRVMAAVPKVLPTTDDNPSPYVAEWQRFLRGLWYSGFRIGESLRLSWEPSADVYAFIGGKGRPMVRFKVKGHKARRDEIWPAPPEFAEILLAVPEDERTGFVFNMRASRHYKGRLSVYRVSELVSAFGAAAKVIVDTETEDTATAHDYRRAFGTRWSKLVMPAVLKRLMRHKDIATTMKFYVGHEADDIADDLYRAVGAKVGAKERKEAVSSEA